MAKFDLGAFLNLETDNYTKNDKKTSDGVIKASHDDAGATDTVTNGDDVIKIDIGTIIDAANQNPNNGTNELEKSFKMLDRDGERVRSDREQIKSICSEYQENGRKSQRLRKEILTGLRNGEDIASLFLKATECISAMTGEKVFYNQTKDDLYAIYGKGLGEPAPLKLVAGEIQGRLEKLASAELRTQEPGELYRIRVAIKQHQQELKELEKQISNR